MKIYPGKHGVYNTSTTNPQEEIPLCYIEDGYITETIAMTINKDFNYNSKIELLPYQELETNNITLYNKLEIPFTEAEQNELLIKENDKYIYTPKASIIFEPYNFKYKVIAKKNMDYISSRKYNIKAACSNMGLARYLIQFFSDSYNRGTCPSNVKFNNGDLKVESLINSSIKENDFIFFDYDDINQSILNECIDSYTIPFIICDNLYVEPKPIEPGTGVELPIEAPIPEKTFQKIDKAWRKGSSNIIASKRDEFSLTAAIDLLEESIVYKASNEYEIDNKKLTNSEPFDFEYFLSKKFGTPGTKYHKLFKNETNKAPIIIKELNNKGFVVFCTAEFINKLSKVSDMFYEILLYIYFRAYISTDWVNEWIADTMPDYIVENNKLTQKSKFTSHIELHKLLKLREGEAIPIEVKIDAPENYSKPIVYYSGMFSNYLIFKKMDIPEFADPIKEPSQISVFTSRKNIMFYDYFTYKIEENLEKKITYEILNNKLKVRVAPFLSSKLNIKDFKLPKNLELNLNNNMSQTIYLYWINNEAILTNNIMIDKPLMATFNITKEKQKSKIYDMRIRGGGLPEASEDNYDCLDIGSTLGRPYRKGGALITTITLPIKYQERKLELYNIIYEAIKKYMIAEDYLVLNLEFK